MSTSDFSDLPLIPATEDGPDAASDAANANQSVLDAAGNPQPSPAPPPVPFGRTARFDFTNGVFVKVGGSPVWVTGLDALAQWCYMTIHSARFAHAIFTDDFGMEDPESVIGEAADMDEAISDWGDRLQDALTVHDRITGVENFAAHYDADNGAVVIDSMTVVTDDDELNMTNVAVPVGGPNG